jgi:hypothetical protein
LQAFKQGKFPQMTELEGHRSHPLLEIAKGTVITPPAAGQVTF